ncbi:MAG: lipopolysaccharide biosynthesis protein, partial [Saprospiraceae bacterium]
ILLKKMLFYALPLILVQLAGVSNQLLDRILLRRLLPGTDAENLAQLGIYGNNFKLAMMVAIFTQAYRYAAEPFFFKQAAEPNAPDTLAKAARAFTIFAAVGTAGVLLEVDVLKHMLTPGYFEGLKVLPPLLMANLLMGIYYNISVWYRLRDKTAYGAWITLAALAFTLLANLLLTPRIGYMGAALAAMASGALMCWAAWYWGQKHYPVHYPWADMALYGLTPFGLYALLAVLKRAYPAAWLSPLAGTALLLGFVVWIIRRERIWPDLRARRFGP